MSSVSELGTFAGCSSAPAPPFKSYTGAGAAASKSAQLRNTGHDNIDNVENFRIFLFIKKNLKKTGFTKINVSVFLKNSCFVNQKLYLC